MENVVYQRYPLKSVAIYNLVTVLHYVLGFVGILIAFDSSSIGKIIATAYISFAFLQMYVLMPMIVCPNCVYTKKLNMFCISGLNIIARKYFPNGDISNFGNRGKGILCHNNLYLSAKVLPLLIILPFLFINFSFTLLIIFFLVLGLMLFRVFYIFQKIACNRCLAKNICPNAKSMGLSDV
jgi:hypothetical protein